MWKYLLSTCLFRQVRAVKHIWFWPFHKTKINCGRVRKATRFGWKLEPQSSPVEDPKGAEKKKDQLECFFSSQQKRSSLMFLFFFDTLPFWRHVVLTFLSPFLSFAVSAEGQLVKSAIVCGVIKIIQVLLGLLWEWDMGDEGYVVIQDTSPLFVLWFILYSHTGGLRSYWKQWLLGAQRWDC